MLQLLASSAAHSSDRQFSPRPKHRSATFRRCLRSFRVRSPDPPSSSLPRCRRRPDQDLSLPPSLPPPPPPRVARTLANISLAPSERSSGLSLLLWSLHSLGHLNGGERARGREGEWAAGISVAGREGRRIASHRRRRRFWSKAASRYDIRIGGGRGVMEKQT